MRKMILGFAVVLAVVGTVSKAEAQPIPPVQVGPVVIGGDEAQEMIDELAHHRRHHYHRAGQSIDWLVPSSMQLTPAPGLPPIFVNGVFITGHEGEEMIDKLSHMRRHRHWRAFESLEWLGIGQAAPAPIVVQQPPVVMVPAPVVMAPPPPVVMAPAPVVMAPAPVVMAPAPVVAPVPVVAAAHEPDLSRFILTSHAQGWKDHASAGLGIAYEGKRWGFNLNGGATVYRKDPACDHVDFKLIDAHLTFAPISGERGRLRIEVGANVAFAKEAFLLGPDFGLSGDVRIVGPLGIMGYVHGTGWPYKYVDGFAGIFAKLSIVRIEGGWRYMIIEADKDGSKAKDNWNGPYLGLSLVI